ncbi:hypothetical protein ACFSTD_19865 [Novosphingobium colocasiae]
MTQNRTYTIQPGKGVAGLQLEDRPVPTPGRGPGAAAHEGLFRSTSAIC